MAALALAAGQQLSSACFETSEAALSFEFCAERFGLCSQWEGDSKHDHGVVEDPDSFVPLSSSGTEMQYRVKRPL
eukprot:1993431-Rhodomonas_salina.1